MEKKDKKKNKSLAYRILLLLGKILAGLLILVFLLLLFIRSEWGQNLIKDKLISSISNKTQTQIEIDRLFITFSGDVFLEGLFLEDKKGDTLVYSNELQADIPFWPIINGGDIRVRSLVSQGFKANIIREDSVQGFNYEFLMEALAPKDTTQVVAPDTTSAQRNFIIEELDIARFDLTFLDEVAGMDTEVKVGNLYMDMEVFDLENMSFHASEASLSNASISYSQTKPFPEKENEEEVPLPYIIADELHLEKVDAFYESVPDGLLANIMVGDLTIELPELDLDQNIIEVTYFHLQESDVFLNITPIAIEEKQEQANEESTGFQWPDWAVLVEEVILEDNNIAYSVDGAESREGVFNPNALYFKNLNLVAEDIYLKDKSTGASLSGFSFNEGSGLRLRESGLVARIDEQELNLQDLEVYLNNNILKGNLQLDYPSLRTLMEEPSESALAAQIPQFLFHLEDIYRFQPSLKTNEYFRGLARKNLSGSLRADGTLAAVRISSADINWGSSTDLDLRGSIRNPTEPESLSFDFPSLSLVTTNDDLGYFIEQDSLGVKLPEQVTLMGTVAGNLEQMSADLDLESSQGTILMKGDFNTQGELAFNADVEILELDLGAILQNEQLGKLSLRLDASGQGENLNTLDATLDSEITSFHFNDYKIDSLGITGEIIDGRGPIYANYKDENLNLEMENMLILDSVASQVNINLDVPGANLQALGLTSRLIKVGFGFDASFKGDTKEYDVNAEIVDGVTVYGSKSYLLGDFLVSARVRADSTALDIRNQILDVSLRSNADPASFANALQRHYRSYLSETIEIDTVLDPVNLNLEAEIRENPILDEVFLTQLEELDTVNINVDFHEKEREMFAEIEVPYVSYMGGEVDSLFVNLESGRDSLDVDFGFFAINAGPVQVKETTFMGGIRDKTFFLDFDSYHGEEHLAHLSSEITRRSDTVTITLDPSKVIMDSKKWEVPESNMVWIAPNYMSFRDFSFVHDGRRMEITHEEVTGGEEEIKLNFDNFSLLSFMSYFNPEEPLATGDIDGSITVENPFGSKGLIADVDIHQFHVLQVPMGVLSMEAEALSYNDYNFDLAIKEGNIDLDLTGEFTASEGGAQWHTELDLHRVEMEVLEAFSFGEIRESEGSISGSADLSGTFVDPYYEGRLVFNDVGFTLAKLNAPLHIRNETLAIDTTGFAFNDFQIEDVDGNLFTVNGEVMTTEFLNPDLDLTFQAEDFMLLNSTREDNDLFYGKAVFDLDASLTGTLNVPNLQMELDVGPETNVTYIIPESQVGIERREGIVAFVNRENPDAILTATEKESYAASGMEVEAVVDVNEDAIFNIVIDEQTGDNLQVQGEGNLLFNIFSNGRMNLSGRYEMSGGHYEMNLYGLVNRRFEIVEGSSISWAGDPLDANLDVRARYRVETSASDLMAAQISGAETSVRNRYRQELPFLVYLDIGGELMQPVLNFGLDMPEEEQGAIGGQVYGRVQQVNQQEQELNQQVFSLLVLNRFYPSTGSDGSGGGTLNIARDNLNDALSDQLNVLSQNVLGEESSFALDFGLDSFTDYQGESPRERTQLDITAEKAFMDDRLVMRVGSEVDIQGSPAPGENVPLIGNVSLEYLIDESGTWRLRGFRSNRFENVIEGQVIVNGIALIFQREFNEFKELFQKVKDVPE